MRIMGLVLLFVALTLGSVMPDRLKKLRSRTPLKEQLGGAAKLFFQWGAAP